MTNCTFEHLFNSTLQEGDRARGVVLRLYKEIKHFETLEECELRRRDLAAMSLDTPSTALNPQDLRTEVPVPMMYACVLG